MRNHLLITLLTLAISALMACQAHAEKQPRKFPVGIVQDFVWTDDADIDPLIKLAKESGADYVRICIRWAVVEPKKDEWDFSKVDRVVRKLREANLGIYAILLSVPRWANGTEGKQVEGWYDTYPPNSDQEWAEYVRTVVSRYKKDIKLWEIWNEENGQDFYRPMPDASRYVQLLKTAYQACKKADPKCKVLLGSLQMNGVIANPWSPVKITNFLQKIYDAGGKPYFDLINIHPYVLPRKEEGPELMRRYIQGTIDVARKNGDGQKPIWVTEIGCGTNEIDTQQAQTELLEGSFKVISEMPEVGAAFWFCLRDYKDSVTGPEQSMGIVTQKLEKKPAFYAFQRAARQYGTTAAR